MRTRIRQYLAILTCIIAGGSFFGHAQEDLNPRVTAVSGGFQYGFLIPHRPHMHSLIKGHVRGFSVSAEWLGGREKEWKEAYHNPLIGAEFTYLNLGNAEQLGNSYSGFITLNLALNQGQSWRSGLRMGLGFSQLTKTYALVENPKNLAIGSSINGAIFLNYILTKRLHENWYMSGSLRLTHFSNGSFQIPNLGLNIVTAGLGITYMTGEIPAHTHVKVPTPDSSFYVIQGFGLKENFPPLGQKYPAFTLGIGYDHRLSYKFSIGARLDGFYSYAVKASQENKDESVNFGNVVQSGLAVGIAQHVGNMLIRFQTGAYLFDPYKDNGRIYNRILIEHMLGKHLFGVVGLKTHFAKADHFEIGIGWRK